MNASSRMWVIIIYWHSSLNFFWATPMTLYFDSIYNMGVACTYVSSKYSSVVMRYNISCSNTFVSNVSENLDVLTILLPSSVPAANVTRLYTENGPITSVWHIIYYMFTATKVYRFFSSLLLSLLLLFGFFFFVDDPRVLNTAHVFSVRGQW